MIVWIKEVIMRCIRLRIAPMINNTYNQKQDVFACELFFLYIFI